MGRDVSIITVCYNSEKTIRRTIESVLYQSVPCMEYIIIDGASRDSTLEIIGSYKERFKGRLKLVSEPDNGIYDAMNKGIRLAKGELIGIINSDDYYERDAIETICAEYDGSRHMVLYGIQRNFLNGKEISAFIYHHENLSHQMITHPTCFVTKKTYEDFGMFDVSYKSSADYEMMLRFYHETDTAFKAIYRVISNFELGGMSSSEIGYRETLELMYRYGTISKCACAYRKARSRVKQCLVRIHKCMGRRH